MTEELKKLIKKIGKYYWEHNQEIVVDTLETMENNETDYSFDICLVNSNIFLFTIQNYNVFKDVELVNKSYFQIPKHKWVEVWDGIKASCTPLYFDRTITLKTFKPITKEDIINASDYFIHEILGLWCILNIKFKENEQSKETKR